MRETIYALATPPGVGGVAIVRVSGRGAFDGARALVQGPLPVGRQAGLRTLKAADGAVLDTAVVIAFEGPRSFTGEDVVEFHCHGGRAVVAAVLERLRQIDGLEVAEPGEFTRRAFENGRLSLLEVEALADLLAAETEAQRRLAQQSLDGGLGHRASAWGAALTDALALLEATIDWVDEEVPEDVAPEVASILSNLSSSLQDELREGVAAERVRDGFEVALVGAPNVGKSSLLNALAGREAALSTAIAGTTRDVLEVRLDLGGVPVLLLDMAGMREASDPVEVLGVDRAMKRAAGADLRLFMRAPGVDVPSDAGMLWRAGDIDVSAKSDLGGGEGLLVSAKTGEGLPALTAAIRQELERRVPTGAALGHARQREAVSKALESLVAAQHALTNDVGVEIVAAYLRDAMSSLAELTGRRGTEAVLDAVFSRFCLGK